MRKRHKMHDVWQSLPTYVDILVTHGPPKGILDLTHDHDTGSLIQVGCTSLRKAVDRIKPKIHAFGHIHDEEGVSNFGIYDNGVTKFINCSVCDRRGKFKNSGLVLEC
jgi:Icc-related predicted phosphoesterase